MKLVIELPKTDAEELSKLAENHPSEIRSAQAHEISGVEWLAFIIDMTTALAPHVFALLTILVTNRRKVIVVKNGERKELTKAELEKLEKGLETNESEGS